MLAVAAVLLRVGGAEADDIVGGSVLLDALKGRREVVRIKESFAASIAGKRGHHFLGIEIGVEVILQRSAVVCAGAAQAAS